MYSWPITFVVEVDLPGLLFDCFGLEINFQKDSAVITDLMHNFDPIDFRGVVGQKEVQGVFASSGFKYHLLKTLGAMYREI